MFSFNWDQMKIIILLQNLFAKSIAKNKCTLCIEGLLPAFLRGPKQIMINKLLYLRIIESKNYRV